jgi:hypothetical protein
MSTCLILKIYFEDRDTQQTCDAPLVLVEAIDKGALEAALDFTYDTPQGISQIEVDYV